MQRELVIKGRSLGGTSDLTLLAPIRPGLIESLESVSHKTRIKRVLDALHAARQNSHEHAAARLVSDSVERVGVIHSVRVAVLEPAEVVLLAVTFDGPWEAYIRVLWDKVGALLDLIFHGTVGYVTAAENPFEAWLGWARSVQVETGFFYGPPDATAHDALYHRRVNALREREAVDPDPAGTPAEVLALRSAMPSAEEATQRLVDGERPGRDDPPLLDIDTDAMVYHRVRTGLQGLAALYRLADLHRPGTPDGEVLRRAAISLLREFIALWRDLPDVQDRLREVYRERFGRALDWLYPNHIPDDRPRDKPARPSDEPTSDAVRADVQGGILRAYPKLTHGAVLMFAFDDTAAAASFLHECVRVGITSDLDPAQPPGGVYRNLSFTAAGLNAAGMDDALLETFPEEFRQGMAARAGSLGDVRHNHPRRWRLPRRFVSLDQPPSALTVEMHSVHAVLLLRCEAAKADAPDEIDQRGHPLRDEIQAWSTLHEHVRLLAVQPMRRRYREIGGKPSIVEHFGYADGDGQPDVEPVHPPHPGNRVHLGEVLQGHANASDFAPDPDDPHESRERIARARWLHNGSFLVMRKYRQFVDRLRDAVRKTAADMALALGGTCDDHEPTVYGKLMGRDRDGRPTVGADPASKNRFSYVRDREGRKCPLHAHVRRANPRETPPTAARPPRIVRRGMAYGPKVEDGETGDKDRGLVFMAYNANLGEQFEVIQRWLIGGNSTGSASGVSCPIVGVPENGLPRLFSFEQEDGAGKAHLFHVQLEPQTPLFVDPQPPTQLEWGLYLFAPSLPALRRLAKLAAAAPQRARPVPWQLEKGRKLLAELRRLDAAGDVAAAREAWKVAIEDPQSIDRLDSAAIWQAIRDDHGGLLRTGYGTLVADRELIASIYLDAAQRYSVRGQLERMRLSFGEISLGMDDGPLYREQADPINQAIGRLDAKEVFEIAREAAGKKIDKIVMLAHLLAAEYEEPRYEAPFDVRELLDEVLADLSEDWFGLKGSPHFERGPVNWQWQSGRPLYPGHFTALSRYMFQPYPGPVPVELGQRYGRALHDAMVRFVEGHWAAGTLPQRICGPGPAPLAKVVFEHPTLRHDVEYVARTLVGVLMGFNPTIYGAVLNVLREWRGQKRFDALRGALAGRSEMGAAYGVLYGPMAEAARMRPMPQIGWRTVRKPHRLEGRDGAGVDLADGDIVVMAMVSGTQQSIADGHDDARLMFGGKRDQTPHPTHACPGYDAGIAAMLGALTGLLAWNKGSLREGPATHSYIAEGDVTIRRAVRPGVREAALQPRVKLPMPPSRRGDHLVAYGDSWFTYRLGGTKDLLAWLEAFGYERIRRSPFCDSGGTIAGMASAINLDPFIAWLDDNLLPKQRAKAIVLSGGGNDTTRGTLKGLIRPFDGGKVLDDDEVENHIAKLEGHYTTVLDRIRESFARQGVTGVPVVIHGYDHPLPRGAMGFDNWLRRPFEEQHYDLSKPAIFDQATQAMADLIDGLNRMLDGLADSERFKPFVRHVNLCGTIAKHFPQDPGDGWANDLHPINDMFGALALRIDEAIQRVEVRQP